MDGSVDDREEPPMPREPRATSAGLVLYRRRPELEVLLGHMGGPYFARRDDGAWSIPKGEYTPDEEPLAAARREFAEELGIAAPADGEHHALGAIRQRNGKQVTAWAVEGDLDVGSVVSNTFEIEWPPHSGRRQSFPEIDRAAWFDVGTAGRKMVAGQAELLDRLLTVLARPAS
jgi:predicted NUDIX family NTP pyrophosphohydrolase